MKTIIAAGASYDNQAPIAEHSENTVLFAFRGDNTTTYLATGPILTITEAVSLIRKRIRHFGEDAGAREGFDDKVGRKLIAAQGRRFVEELKRPLKKVQHGVMEWEMMFPPNTHHSVASRKHLEQIKADKKKRILAIDKRGVVSEEPQKLWTNDGKVWQNSHSAPPFPKL